MSSPEPTPSIPKAKDHPPKDFFTWSTLFKCLMGNCSPAEREAYMNARDIRDEASDCKRCEQWVDWNYKFSPTVRFLRDQIRTVGPDLPKEKVFCRRCPNDRKGGMDIDYGILLCSNHNDTKKRIEDTLAHEMVHVYDSFRFKYDRDNLKHVACTEIRASMLSGECRFLEEWLYRKQLSLTGKDGMGQFQDCVRRRATQSVMSYKTCKSETQARGAVKEVWGSCFSDTRPFDEVYR